MTKWEKRDRKLSKKNKFRTQDEDFKKISKKTKPDFRRGLLIEE